VAVLPSIREFTLFPATITEGEPIMLTWDVVDAQEVTIVRDDGRRFVGGAKDEWRDRPPVTTRSYRLTARNATGDMQETPNAVVQVTVQAQPTPTPPPPTPVPTPTQPPLTQGVAQSG
jgi:hypothetical protein